MKLESIRRIAAGLLNTGEKKVWFDPSAVGEISKCITRDDILEKIKEGSIKKAHANQHSRARARILHEKRRKGRKRGFGKRRGTQKSRIERKKRWMERIRGQRAHLKKLLAEKKISKKEYVKFYNMATGGYFKGKRYIDLALKQTGGKK